MDRNRFFMKRRIALFMALILAVGLISACSKKVDVPGTSLQEDTAADTAGDEKSADRTADQTESKKDETADPGNTIGIIKAPAIFALEQKMQPHVQIGAFAEPGRLKFDHRNVPAVIIQV